MFAYVGASYVGVGKVVGTVTPAADAEFVDPDTGEVAQLATGKTSTRTSPNG